MPEVREKELMNKCDKNSSTDDPCYSWAVFGLRRMQVMRYHHCFASERAEQIIRYVDESPRRETIFFFK